VIVRWCSPDRHECLLQRACGTTRRARGPPCAAHDVRIP
jgi:hypothetical protein